MHVVHPNNLFSSDLMLKKACVLYMPAWYTQRFTVNNIKGKLLTNNGNSLEIMSGTVMVLMYYTCPQCVLSVFEIYGQKKKK